MAQDSSFLQYIGAGINPVVPAFSMVLAFRSFLLSCHSSFPPFQLSGHTGNYLVVPVTENIRNLKKGEGTEQFATCCLLSINRLLI
jgi:hypothetical protein